MLITDNVDVGGDDTDSNSDSDGFANQDEEAISVKEPNWTLQEDMKVEHEHVDTIDFHAMHDQAFEEEHLI